MIRKLFLLVLLLSIVSVCFAQGDSEQLTITTYYPSPYGVYKTLRLFPQELASGDPCTNAGEMAYSNSANPNQVLVCNGSTWNPLGGTGQVTIKEITSPVYTCHGWYCAAGDANYSASCPDGYRCYTFDLTSDDNKPPTGAQYATVFVTLSANVYVCNACEKRLYLNNNPIFINNGAMVTGTYTLTMMGKGALQLDASGNPYNNKLTVRLRYGYSGNQYGFVLADDLIKIKALAIYE